MKNIVKSLFGRKSLGEVVRPADGVKSTGTREKPDCKVLAITDLEIKADGGVVTIKGYANTKGKADRYGDVPTVMPAIRNYVYELSEFRKNPVMLLDHYNSVGAIAGSFKVLQEDEKGLRFEAEFSKSDFPPVAHARTVYSEGHGKALSIAGRWFFENKDAQEQLTYADIFEISLVGVGADPNALAGKAAEAAPTEPPKVTPAPTGLPAPCCFRHAGKTVVLDTDGACATAEQVVEELQNAEAALAVSTFTKSLEDSAAVAEIERFLQTQGA